MAVFKSIYTECLTETGQHEIDTAVRQLTRMGYTIWRDPQDRHQLVAVHADGEHIHYLRMTDLPRLAGTSPPNSARISL